MAKYCTKCGKELKDGKKCDCSKEKKVEEKETSKTVATTQGLFNECVEIVTNFLKKPIDTIEENAKEEKTNHALVMLVVNAIAVGLFTMALSKQLIATIMDLMGYGSLTSLATSSTDIPYGKIFIIAFIASFALSILLATFSYLISAKVFKNETSFKKMLTLFGFSSIILSVSLLLGAILTFVNIYIGLVVYVAGSLLNTYYNYKGLEFVCDTDRNKLGYVLMPSVLVSSFIVGYLLPKIFM